MCIIINQHHEVAFGQNKHYEVAAVVYASKTGLRRIWQLHWKLKDKKMKQSGGPLLKLRREMMCYLRKLGIVNTGPTSFKAHQLQDTVQKLQVDAISRLSNFGMEKQEGAVVKNVHTETHGINENLIRRNEDLLKRNDDLVKKIEDSGKLVTQLHENLERLEVKSANLESENQALRQQAITTPPSTAKSQAACSKIKMSRKWSYFKWQRSIC